MGTVAQNTFRQCYTRGSVVTTSDSVYYTLDSSSRHSNLNQRRTREQPLNWEARGSEETVLTDNHTLEEMGEDVIIVVNPQANYLENLPSNNQIFVQIPDIWSKSGRKPAYIQTIPDPLTLGLLKPENFEQFLERNDISFPVHQAEWEAFLNYFKEHWAGIAKHVDFKINPARKYRLLYKASVQPRAPPTGKLMKNETFTLSNLNILSARPLIMALAELCLQPGTTGYWSRKITFRPPDQIDPRMGTGSATISILRTAASDQTLYDLYVTRTKSLLILGQESQPTWHLHR